MDYLSFYLTVGWHLRRLARADDVVVAMTDPPLLSVLVYWALTGRPVRVVNWLQDLYPEVATALGVGALGGRLGAWLRQVRNRSLRHATLNVAIGERMAKAVRATGIPSGQVRVLHNWADCEAIRPLAPAANRLRREWGVEDAFVVGYSGNLGRAHAYATVLDAAALLWNRGGGPTDPVCGRSGRRDPAAARNL
ncbi:glycosyltransferase [uncultured Thiodictyon sp.]|uniref:glycosyltransferase n=1 Tax=uncultured Thiodictyon sp. TaxID=1846217 RepID=UPI0025E48814|nr:glycosyltransferase [uncultured Thiodictyon sp.]